LFAGEGKIVNLEEELRVVGENLKALEVAEEKAQLREEEYKKQMRIITERLKTAESRQVEQKYMYVGTYVYWSRFYDTVPAEIPFIPISTVLA
jgi:chromosome segregation ATPase